MANLQSSVLFSGIIDSKRLINCLSPRVKQFAKNEIILLSGDYVQGIGVILTGTANAYLEHINGDQTLMSRLKPTSVFGEILVSTRTHKSPVTVYAMSDVSVAFIDYEKVLAPCFEVCDAHIKLIKNMQKAIGDKYFRLFDRINILREKTLRDKITAYLNSLRESGKCTHVTIPFSKTLLADYLLANRSALSKEMRKMEDDGLIIVKGRNVQLLF